MMVLSTEVTEVRAHVVGHIGGEAGPAVVHGQQHGGDVQSRIEVDPDQLRGVQQLLDALERVVLALDREQHLFGGHQRVQRQQPQRRRTVDQHVVKVRHVERAQRPGQPQLPRHHRDQFDLRPGEVDGGRRAVQAGHLPGRLDDLGQRTVVDQHVVDGGNARVVRHIQRRRCVPLRVQVHHQYARAVLRQAGGQVYRRGRLADPALLVRDRHDPAARRPRPRLTVALAPHADRGLRGPGYRRVRRVRSESPG